MQAGHEVRKVGEDGRRVSASEIAVPIADVFRDRSSRVLSGTEVFGRGRQKLYEISIPIKLMISG